MTISDYNKLLLIDKIKVLHKEYKRIKQEYDKGQSKFDNFLENIEDCYPHSDLDMNEKMYILNMMLSKSDELYHQVNDLNILLQELKSILCN